MEELAKEIIKDILDGECYCDKDILKEVLVKVDMLRTIVCDLYNNFDNFDDEK